MGALTSCCRDLCGESGGTDQYETIGGTSGQTPDPEERRRQLAEAAEKRRQEAEGRGVKDVEAVKRMQERTRKRDEAEEEMARRGVSKEGPELQWTVT